MIKVLYSPQFNLKDELTYKFEGEKITAQLNGEIDIFDFTPLPEGQVDSVESDLKIDVVTEAYRKDGILHVKLLNFISKDATQEELFPTWKVIQ